MCRPKARASRLKPGVRRLRRGVSAAGGDDRVDWPVGFLPHPGEILRRLFSTTGISLICKRNDRRKDSSGESSGPIRPRLAILARCVGFRTEWSGAVPARGTWATVARTGGVVLTVGSADGFLETTRFAEFGSQPLGSRPGQWAVRLDALEIREPAAVLC